LAKLTFRLGDAVRIKSGPFAQFRGRVAGINQTKALLKVAVEIMGREADIRLRFGEVEKL
jgi:transcriptional antiterminator NusG